MSEPQLWTKLWLISLGLFLFIRVGFTDGDIGVTPFFFEAAAEVIMATVYGAGAAFAGHEVMAVCGFDFVAADIAADRVFDNHCLSSLKSSLIRCAPVWRPSM